MPFDRSGNWTIPDADDHASFQRHITTKRQEITPTPEMMEAIASNLPKVVGSGGESRKDLFNSVGKLKGPCDIVIPVYDGLHVLKPCIESVLARTDWSYRLIIVDDCSPDPEIRKYLERLERKHPEFTIAFNKRNRGFAPTVNRGVGLGENPYVCILNTDTIVTQGWLVRQLVALEADERNVIATPATNNAALINVPVYNGHSYLDMANAAAIDPNVPVYPEIMPTGFCFTFRRSLWGEVGPFDEAYVSYGEETHFWFNAIKMTDENGVILRNRGVLTDNAYVYHERGVSFSQLGDDEHMGLRRSGSERFNKLNPSFGSWRQGFNAEAAVHHLRNDLPVTSLNEYKGNVAWVVKSAGPCGGMAYITDIANEMIERGYNVKICVVAANYNEAAPPDLTVIGNLRTAPILFKSHDEFVSTFAQRVFTRGKVFAAVTEMTGIVWDLDQAYPKIEGYNHVQSYDVDLAERMNAPELAETFRECYKRLPNVCSSKWIAELLEADGCDVRDVILPGVNPDLFHPRNREAGDERFTVAVYINEQYPWRGADWALKFVKALEPSKNPQLRVLAIGPDALTKIRGVTCLGNLPQAKLAHLLGSEVDVLVDPAEIHSYGLPALEGLYSGCAIVTRENKGVHDYEEMWAGRLMIEECPEAAADYVRNMDKLPRKGNHHPSTDRAASVRKFINFVFPPAIPKKQHRIEVITPHLRKHGGPTTILSIASQLQALRHRVDISMLHPDWNPEVLNMASAFKVREQIGELSPDADVVLINSDNPIAAELMEKYPEKQFLMLKLSHNPRFQKTENDNLTLPWTHIMTSTEWLRQACIEPMEGWTHPAWSEAQVTTLGWYHYGHKIFNMNPTNRTYGNADVGFRLGTLIHPYALKGTMEALGVIDALKRKYEANFHAVGFGEQPAKIPGHMQYVLNATRADMAHVFQQLDVWYGASHSEGLGRLALEAMSAGIAVVTTDTGAEFLRDGENCLLYPIGDAQAGGEAVDRLVNDRELFTKLVVNGYETARVSADPKPVRQRLSQILQEIVK